MSAEAAEQARDRIDSWLGAHAPATSLGACVTDRRRGEG